MKPAQAVGRLFAGLAAASDRLTLEVVSRKESNPILLGLALAAELPEGAAFADLFDQLWSDLGRGCPEGRLHDLKVEQCRLYQGPPSPLVSPYAAAYLAEGHPGACARSVAEAYGSAGVAMSEAVRDRPDHVATELEFLAALCRAQGGEGADPLCMEPDAAGRVHAAFFRDHASRWLPRFARSVQEQARTRFHRVYGAALEAAVAWDAGLIPKGG